MDEKSAIRILKKYAPSDKDFEAVLNHSRALQKFAVEIAEKIQLQNKDIIIDIDFIKTAALLHDIGRFKHPPGSDSVKHGVAGADILRKEGVAERYARVCERHLGAGISKEEIEEKGLPIPAKDYLPESIEERIITYADNLLSAEKRISPEHAVKRFTEELGEEVGKRVKKLHDELHELAGK